MRARWPNTRLNPPPIAVVAVPTAEETVASETELLHETPSEIGRFALNILLSIIELCAIVALVCFYFVDVTYGATQEGFVIYYNLGHFAFWPSSIIAAIVHQNSWFPLMTSTAYFFMVIMDGVSIAFRLAALLTGNTEHQIHRLSIAGVLLLISLIQFGSNFIAQREQAAEIHRSKEVHGPFPTSGEDRKSVV